MRILSQLLDKEGHTPYHWRPGTEPPDRFLDVHAMTIAVEITSIHGSGVVGGEQLPWPQIEAEIEKKVRPMLRCLETDHPNAGVHLVTLEPLRDTASYLPAIKAALSAHLERTIDLSETKRDETIWRHGPARITAKKVKPGETRFATPFYLNEGRSGRVDHRLEELFHDAAKGKLEKLAEVAAPKALVVLDRYLSQRDLLSWREALPPEASTFVFVARVQSEVAEWVLPPRWLHTESGAR